MSDSERKQFDISRDAIASAPRVSVIIPTFNDPKGVTACLAHISAQSYPLAEIEVIVVDNGSSPPITIAEPPPFPAFVVRCETSGSYAARNAGANRASGDVLAFIDADCWPSKSWLASGVECLMRGNHTSVVGGEVSLVEPENPTAVSLYQCATGFGQESNVTEKGFAATANLFCTRAQFDTVGPFDERLLSGGDREWCWRAANHGITVMYERSALVFTAPRSGLRAAVRQARRVAAGRAGLRRLDTTRLYKDKVKKKRTIPQATTWILTNDGLSIWNRLRVLCVAILIRGAETIERCRLALGATPERR